MNLNYKKFIASFFIVVTVSSLIILTYLVGHYKDKVQDSHFVWSALNLKIQSILGSRLKCKDVEWCGNLKLCAKDCKTEDGILEIEQFTYSILQGKTLTENWKINSLPTKLSKRTDFPQIPLLINRMEFTNGDFSSVKSNAPRIKIIHMQRSSPFGQRWNTEVNDLHNNISLSGFTGDKSYLTLDLKNYQIQEKDFSALVNGHLLFRNEDFQKKPFQISTEDLSFTKLKVLNVPTENFQVSASVQTNPSMNKLREIKYFALKSHNLNIHSKALRPYNLFGFPQKAQIILEPVRAGFFNPYIKNQLSKYSFHSLEGKVSAEALVSLSDFKKTKIKIFLKPLKFFLASSNKEIGSVSGFLTILEKNISEAALSINDIKLNSFSSLIEKQGFKIETGLLNGELKIENKNAKGNLQLTNANLTDTNRNISLSGGKGTFLIKDKSLTGEAIFNLMENPANKISFKLNALFKDFKKPKIDLKLSSKKLIFQNFSLKKENLSLNGSIHNLDGAIVFDNPQQATFNLQFEPTNLNVISPQIGQKKVEFLTGKIRFGSNSRLDVFNLKGSLSESEFFILNGLFKLLPNKPLEALKVQVQAQTKFSTLLEFLPVLKKDIRMNFIQNIQNPVGQLNSDFEIIDSKLNKLKINLQDVGLIYKNQKLSNGSGIISFPGYGVLDVNNLSLKYGNKSSLYLNGKFLPSNELLTNASVDGFLDSIASFNGNLQGLIYLNDFFDQKTQQKLNITLSSESLLPISAEINAIDGKMFEATVSSSFKNLGSLNSSLFPADKLSTDGSFRTNISVKPSDGYFKIENFECSLRGLNIVAQGEGKLDKFDIKLFTDPVIDLGELFANNTIAEDTKTPKLHGALIGWLESKNINLFDKKSFWENMRLSFRTDDLQSIEVGPVELTSLEGYFESKDGKGYSTLVVDKGIIKNLPFNELNLALNLKDNILQMPGMAFKTAGGDVTLKGNIELPSLNGLFSGEANALNVGSIARGLSGQRGLSGTGDFTFKVDGHLLSLIKGEKPVFGSGSFNLRNGNTSAVVDLQKKLNLANLVFNGPLALNINSLLEFLSPTTNGFYKTLYGRWELDKDWILIPEASYRGTNKLNINSSGHFERKNSKINFNFIGSIPRIPVRVNPGSEFSNIFSQLNFANILGHLPIIDKLVEIRPRVFSFNMNGNYNDQQQLNNSSSVSFKWLDSSLHSNLPTPKLPIREEEEKDSK